MRVNTRKSADGGFAVIELVLVLVIVAGIVGIGVYVFKQKQNANDLTATTATTVPTVKSVAKVPAAGTSAAIDELTNTDASAEMSASNGSDNQLQQDALSANTTVSNVGGAYNESSF